MELAEVWDQELPPLLANEEIAEYGSLRLFIIDKWESLMHMSIQFDDEFDEAYVEYLEDSIQKLHVDTNKQAGPDDEHESSEASGSQRN